MLQQTEAENSSYSRIHKFNSRSRSFKFSQPVHNQNHKLKGRETVFRHISWEEYFIQIFKFKQKFQRNISRKNYFDLMHSKFDELFNRYIIKLYQFFDVLPWYISFLYKYIHKLFSIMLHMKWSLFETYFRVFVNLIAFYILVYAQKRWIW